MKRCLLFCAALAAAPSYAAVVDSSPAGFTVENSVIVPAGANVSWNALVHHVDEWWPKEHSWFGKQGKFSIEPRAGGCFCEKAGNRQALHMTVSFVDPGHSLRMLGGLGPLQKLGLTGTMDWIFEPVGGGGSTKITLRYVAGGYTTTDLVKFAKVVDEVQGLQLGGLAGYLSKARPTH